MTLTAASNALMDCGEFCPVLADGRWELQLAGRESAGDPLVITGAHLGADAQLGIGELEHAIIRFLAPAIRWLIADAAVATDGATAAHLFGLIARAWQARREPLWTCGRLRLYRVALGVPAGVRYWEPNCSETDQLDLIIWRDDADRPVLTNVYPAGSGWPANGWTDLPAALNSVVAIRDGARLIGTGVVVRTDTVLTARHVVAGRRVGRLGVDRGSRVTDVLTVPLAEFGSAAGLAARSHELSRRLTGIDQHTVDLALLSVPGLARGAGQVRGHRLRPGEHIVVAGYPLGRWTVALGPVTTTAGADVRAHMMAGPGTSGGPAIDVNGEIAGILTMGHPVSGELLIGPQLLTSFIAAAVQRIPTQRDGCHA